MDKDDIITTETYKDIDPCGGENTGLAQNRKDTIIFISSLISTDDKEEKTNIKDILSACDASSKKILEVAGFDIDELVKDIIHTIKFYNKSLSKFSLKEKISIFENIFGKNEKFKDYPSYSVMMNLFMEDKKKEAGNAEAGEKEIKNLEKLSPLDLFRKFIEGIQDKKPTTKNLIDMLKHIKLGWYLMPRFDKDTNNFEEEMLKIPQIDDWTDYDIDLFVKIINDSNISSLYMEHGLPSKLLSQLNIERRTIGYESIDIDVFLDSTPKVSSLIITGTGIGTVIDKKFIESLIKFGKDIKRLEFDIYEDNLDSQDANNQAIVVGGDIFSEEFFNWCIKNGITIKVGSFAFNILKNLKSMIEKYGNTDNIDNIDISYSVYGDHFYFDNIDLDDPNNIRDEERGGSPRLLK